MQAKTFLYNASSELKDELDQAGIVDDARILVQVFTTTSKQPFIKGMLDEILSLLPSATVVGATTPAVIHKGSILDDGTIISICSFDSSELSLASSVFDGETDFLLLGQTLAEQCAREDTRLMLCHASGKALNAESLARGITDVLQETVLAGGIATPPRPGAQSLIFHNDRILNDSIVLVALSGEDLLCQMHFSTDWMMLGTDMEVTDAEDNIVRSLNDTPVREVYSRYLGEEAVAEFDTTSVRFPLLTERDGITIARVGKQLQEDGRLALWGNLYPGEKVRFGIPSPVVAMEDFNFLIDSLEEQPCDALFVYPSQVRMHLLKSLTSDEVSRFADTAPTAGMFSCGQFCYSPGQFSYLHYSQTTLALTEGQDRPRDATASGLRNPFSQDTLEMRAVSRLVNTTARELEEANRSLEQLANTDALTGIFNRHKGQALLKQEFLRARRYNRPLSLIMIDIDDFKRINDTFGHQTGDEALVHVANTIQPLIRQTDALIRWGGEEFLIICPETDLKGTSELAERLREAASATPIHADTRITLSIGVTGYRPEDTQDTLIGRADKALYLSKEQGKNRVTTWD